MSIFNSINISTTGLTAERTRMDIISKNIANANTTRTGNGTPYRRQIAIFKENSKVNFHEYLTKFSQKSIDKQGVKISRIAEDQAPFKKIYDPGHPDADESGYVQMPNVEIVNEMVDMISATRAYEANVTAINSAKAMAMKALDIGR